MSTGAEGRNGVRANRLRDVLLSGDTAVCGWLSSDSGYIAESLSYCGYDAVTVDLQHGMFGMDTAIRMLQAVSAGPAIPMARCPRLDPAEIGKLLDAGAFGIICPVVDTPEQAAALVRACRYPPSGERSYGPARGLLYGGADYLDEADATVLVWAMIESRAALENLEAILSTPGIDGVYVGPNDLALSLGEPPAQPVLPPRTAAALTLIAERAAAAGRFAGVFCPGLDMAVQMAAQGYRLLTPGSDVGILRQAAAQRVARLRGAAATTAEGGGY